MSTLYRLPDLGEGVTEAEIVAWHVKVGDVVTEDAPMLAVLTDKSTVEVPVPRNGRVLHIFAPASTVVSIGAALIDIGAVDDQPYDDPRSRTNVPFYGTPPVPGGDVVIAGLDRYDSVRPPPSTPFVRRLADELGLDLDALAARGPIDEAAVRSEAARLGLVLTETLRPPSISPSITPAAIPGLSSLPPPRVPTIPPPIRVAQAPIEEGVKRREPLRGARRVLAAHLARAQQVPAVTVVEEADVTELELLQQGTGFGLLPYFVQAVVAGFRELPEANAVIDPATRDLVVYDRVNMGIAVQTDAALVVPVLSDCGATSLEVLDRQIVELAEAARHGGLPPARFRGGTFTITYPGHFGGLIATPLLNTPEVAILGVNRTTRRPVVVGDDVKIRSMAYVTLTFDHRAFDGLAAGRFLAGVVQRLSDPIGAIQAGDFH